MKSVQLHLSPEGHWLTCSRAVIDPASQLALVFWSDLEPEDVVPRINTLRLMIPNALILGCSSGGIIQDRLMFEHALSATIISFAHSTVQVVRGKLDEYPDSRTLGTALAEQLPREGLRHVLILSDGLQVNGSRLVQGLVQHFGREISITGGMAGDGIRFERTNLVFSDEVLEGEVICVGFYGEKLRIGIGSQGGFEPFGPERLITASHHNILHEIDGESALALYERYLGKHAQNLPASGHRFPLGLRDSDGSDMIIRSIMGVDRENEALIFSGDMPLGATVQLMKSNLDSLLDGAKEAALQAKLHGSNSLALLISCLGRKQGLLQFVDEEIEAVQSALPAGTTLTGFYSYGEFAPCGEKQTCRLHNQTMTITVFGEED